MIEDDVALAIKTRHWRMLIGGEHRDARSGGLLDILNPATGAVIGRLPRGAADDVDDAVRGAHAAFDGWRSVSAAARAKHVLALAEAMEDHSEELAVLDVLDMGTPIRSLRADVGLALAQMRYFAGLALEMKGETIPTADASTLDFTIRQPFGVVARIVPFNHPLMFAASKLAAPLIAGNTVVLKPSHHTSMSALRLGELAREIIPEGVLSVVTGTGAEVGDCLVRHSLVRRIAFTGEGAVGRGIQAAAAESGLKHVTLELGGKNPLIVFEDADLDAAVAGAVRGMNFSWAGQSCGSTSRLYVHESRIDEFVSKLGQAMESLVVGDPMDEATDVGSLATPTQFAKVRNFIAEGAKAGEIVVGGLPSAAQFGDGLYVLPTLIRLEPGCDSTVVRDEIFGPVVVAIPFSNYAEVVELANDSEYGLTASAWTRSLSTAMHIARDIEAGYVWINWSSSHIPGAPFGGVKGSGVGREEGLDELLSFSQLKNVYVQY